MNDEREWVGVGVINVASGPHSGTTPYIVEQNKKTGEYRAWNSDEINIVDPQTDVDERSGNSSSDSEEAVW